MALRILYFCDVSNERVETNILSTCKFTSSLLLTFDFDLVFYALAIRSF